MQFYSLNHILKYNYNTFEGRALTRKTHIKVMYRAGQSTLFRLYSIVYLITVN